MRFPRITVRHLLLLVAALAVVFGLLVTLQRRRERFRHLASKYRSASNAVYTDGYDVSVQEYHADLAAKYRDAADRLPLSRCKHAVFEMCRYLFMLQVFTANRLEGFQCAAPID